MRRDAVHLRVVFPDGTAHNRWLKGADVNIGIIGLPQTGKKTLFKLLVGPAALRLHTDPRAVHRGVVDVQDPRFDRLVEIYTPRKQTRARLEVVLLPKIEEDAVRQGDILKDMGEVDAFCHVVRAFGDDSVYHVWGGPDPAREVEFVQSEFLLHDLLFVEKRLERLESDLKKAKDERREKERALLLRLRGHLESEKPLRQLELPREERVVIASYPFLTLGQMIVALNISEDRIGDESFLGSFRERFQGRGLSFAQIAMRTEAEIADLATEAERTEFMAAIGIEENALHLLTAKLIEAVGLMSFFTAAHNELRQWFVRRGALAPEAAGVIHTDMERGFIRAEVVNYADIIAHGSEEAVKAAGKYHVKGKDHVIEDGDILNIRFSV